MGSVISPTALPPSQLKDQSVGGDSVVSWRSPRGAPDYPETPPVVIGKASLQLLANRRNSANSSPTEPTLSKFLEFKYIALEILSL